MCFYIFLANPDHRRMHPVRARRPVSGHQDPGSSARDRPQPGDPAQGRLL